MKKKNFSHLTPEGEATMVNVSAKPYQDRKATATGTIVCAPSTIKALKTSALPKGDVLTVAKIAGIQAAKSTSNLIPLCHPLPIHHIDILFKISKTSIETTCTVWTNGKTGVEMEALTGVSITLLTIYDMCKAVDKMMRIENIHVTEKIKS